MLSLDALLQNARANVVTVTMQETKTNRLKYHDCQM